MASQDEQELSLFDLASAKISQAQQLMSEARELLKQDLDNMKQEKSAFQEFTKRLNEVHFGRTIKLNVGGKIYETALSTLQKDPNSMLAAMFSGRHELQPNKTDGSYFIDRDGKLFRYILNYLRNGEFRCPNDRVIQEDLLSEAKFYQVQGVVDHLRKEFDLPLTSSLIIVNKNQRSALLSWLPPGASCSLLYRATTDGGTVKDFHRCCDNKGPTLVLMKSGDYKFGGYTSKSWKSPTSNQVVVDSQCFLFTLVNPSGSDPVKIKAKPSASVGIKCADDLGPRFSEKSGKNALDVHPKDTPSGFEGNLKLNNGFICPKDADNEALFAGNGKFDITELEVFKIYF